MNRVKLKKHLEQFFLEDFGEGDVTSQTIFTNNEQGKGHFTVKKDGVIAGLRVIEEGYQLLNDKMDIKLLVEDGQLVKKGDTVAIVTGNVADLLSGERVILNLLQRMSGIATLTKLAVEALNDRHTRICDTRKTTPGLRMFEKYAVRCGGGYNHRFGLYDGVMIKDNHIAAAGSITAAVERVKNQLGHMVKVEVETETREQVMEAVKAGADVIMFDNRSPKEIKEFVSLVPEGIVTEASGGIQLETLSQFQSTGVDYISLGFLTHSVQSLDISFNVEGGAKS